MAGSARRLSGPAAAVRWRSTRPAWAVSATAAPCWSRSWSAAVSSWSRSITPMRPQRSSSLADVLRRRRCRHRRRRSSTARWRCASPTPASSLARSLRSTPAATPTRSAGGFPPGCAARCGCPAWACLATPLGGATAAEAMFEDRRIKAGVNLDGTMAGAVVDAGLDRPFMLVAAQSHGRDTDASWARFWANLRGWRLNLRLTGAGHNSFTDVQVLLPQIAGVLQLPPEAVQQLIGTVDPHRSVLIQRAYLTAFFNLHLLHRDGRLLTRPSPRFPEMQFVP